tara:strand:- start:199 stop:327 length:129 start_codon:yes stop_codon:yes gene_type:complete
MLVEIVAITLVGLFMAMCITGTILLVMDAEDRLERKRKRKRK